MVEKDFNKWNKQKIDIDIRDIVPSFTIQKAVADLVIEPPLFAEYFSSPPK